VKIPSPACALIIAVSLTAGCASSQTARIQEKSAVFEQLTPKEQNQILHQKVRTGFTADMVYLALGRPSQVATVNDAAGIALEEWTYKRPIAAPDRIITGVIDQFPEFRPGDAFHATRAQPGSEVIRRNEGDPMTEATAIFTLQVRFSAGKVVWMKLT